jgi:hypothetical protein
MSEVYDVGFEQARLDQLREKYLEDLDIQGELYFYACLDEVRLDVITPFMSDEAGIHMKDSGFRYFLYPLLDDLMMYRKRCGESDCTGGHLSFSTESIRLTWLGAEMCRLMVEEKRGWAL